MAIRQRFGARRRVSRRFELSLGCGLRKKGVWFPILDSITNLFHDPAAAIIERNSARWFGCHVLRDVRYGLRVQTFVFLPLRMGSDARGGGIFGHNYFVAVNLYGLLIMADALLLNIFGVDRGAAQLYFVTPVPFETVIKAKNLAACVFILVQNLLVAILTPLFTHVLPWPLFRALLPRRLRRFTSCGPDNLLSVIMPRPIDPNSPCESRLTQKCNCGFCFVPSAWRRLLAWLPCPLGF